MLKIIKLSKNNLSSPDDFSYWENALYAVASRHFDKVPKSDIEKLLQDVKNNIATVHVITKEDEPHGFDVVLYRSILINNKIENYLMLDVGCIDQEVRGHHLIGILWLRNIIQFKFRSFYNLFHTPYALAVAVSLESYVLSTKLKYWTHTTSLCSKNKTIFDAILSSHCKEFNIHYSAQDDLIHYESWIPFYDHAIMRKNKKIRDFLRQHPNWQLGNGLPIVYPISIYNLSACIFKVASYRIKNLFNFLMRQH